MHSEQWLLPVTVVVPTKNEGSILEACLSRLDRFAEIVVIDSGSTDNTAIVAEKYGAKLIQFNWNGKYPKKRNWYLLQGHHTQPWVLFLDADELMNNGVCNAISEALSKGTHDGFWLYYTNYFLGGPLRHGLSQRKLALFKIGAGLYERIDEAYWTTLDMEVHEHPIINGRVGQISEKIDHYDDKGISHLINKHIAYAEWEARRFGAFHSERSLPSTLSFRQRVKYRCLDKWWFPFAYFVFVYFFKLGILDGRRGFYFAAFKASYFFNIGLILKSAH